MKGAFYLSDDEHYYDLSMTRVHVTLTSLRPTVLAWLRFVLRCNDQIGYCVWLNPRQHVILVPGIYHFRRPGQYWEHTG
jgi:hypothetical protein